jgi:hypothetical protein
MVVCLRYGAFSLIAKHATNPLFARFAKACPARNAYFICEF